MMILFETVEQQAVLCSPHILPPEAKNHWYLNMDQKRHLYIMWILYCL